MEGEKDSCISFVRSCSVTIVSIQEVRGWDVMVNIFELQVQKKAPEGSQSFDSETVTFSVRSDNQLPFYCLLLTVLMVVLWWERVAAVTGDLFSGKLYIDKFQNRERCLLDYIVTSTMFDRY